MAVGSDVITWATAVSTNSQNGRKIIFRYAEQLNPTFDPASQPIRSIIVWKYESENGQPIAEEHQRMILLEDALESALEEEHCATLAMVSTGEGLREWTYYAKSDNESWLDSTTPLLGSLHSPSKFTQQATRIGRCISNSERVSRRTGSMSEVAACSQQLTARRIIRVRQ